jgi:hypothetical protein
MMGNVIIGLAFRPPRPALRIGSVPDEWRQVRGAFGFGGRLRAGVMTKRWRLNLPMIRRLHARLAIPIECLVRTTSSRRRAARDEVAIADACRLPIVLRSRPRHLSFVRWSLRPRAIPRRNGSPLSRKWARRAFSGGLVSEYDGHHNVLAKAIASRSKALIARTGRSQRESMRSPRTRGRMSRGETLLSAREMRPARAARRPPRAPVRPPCANAHTHRAMTRPLCSAIAMSPRTMRMSARDIRPPRSTERPQRGSTRPPRTRRRMSRG